MDNIGFIKLSHPYPLWFDDIENHISRNNFGIDTLQGIPLVRRQSETLNFVKDSNPAELIFKNMNILLHLVSLWAEQNELTDDIVLWYQLKQIGDGWDVRINCDAYKLNGGITLCW